jgi:tetratricopeptide (TPR) repeat protein
MLRTIGSLALLVFYAWAIFMPRADASGSADELRALAERSRTLLQAGRHADALAPALTLREAHPANLVYLKQLATIYGQLGRSREEAEAWESFVASAPSPEEACPYIADAYVRQGLVKASVDAFERCLVFDPDNPDAMLSLARAIERGEPPRARALYERGLAIAPNYQDLRLGLARLDLREGRLREAREAAAIVIAGRPDDADALLVAGLAYQREGNLVEARKALERGTHLAPNDVDFVTALGLVAETQGRIDDARTYYAKAFALSPNDPDARTRLQRVSVQPGTP